MKKHLLLIALWLGTGLISYAQFEKNYTPLECKGKIPERILTSLKDKLKNSGQESSTTHQSEKEKKLRSQYNLETNFVLDRLLQSGSVLFNDEVSVYLNSVAQELLKNDAPSFRNNILIYTLRSTAVNAFATERGEIFVTLGLLAKLNSKEELAFILSHEISHVLRHHNLNKYVTFESKGPISKKRDSTDERVRQGKFPRTSELLRHCLYSQAIEVEADSLGTIRYLQAGFNTNDLFHVFDALETAQLPFTKEEFPYKIFESPHYKIPDSIKHVLPDSLPENMKINDSLSSHPGINKRREMLRTILSQHPKIDNATRSGADYQRIQQIARLEMPWMYLNEEKLPMAVYTAGCLLKQYPQNAYLQLCIAQALYLRAFKRNKGIFTAEELHLDQGSKAIDSLMRGLSKRNYDLLALYYLINLSKDQQREDVYAMLDDLSDMSHRFISKSGDGMDYYPLQDLFVKHQDLDISLKESLAELKKNLSPSESDSIRYQKILLLNPEYISIDHRGKAKIEYLETAEGQKRVSEQMKFSAGKSHLNIESLDVKNLQENDVDRFNDIRYLSDYISLQFEYESKRNVTLPGKEKVGQIMQKYQCNYLLLSGFVSVHQRNNSIMYLPLGFVFWPIIPVTILAMMAPKYDLLYFNILDDISRNKWNTVNYNYFKVKENNTLLKAHTYHTFYTIAHKLQKEMK